MTEKQQEQLIELLMKIHTELKLLNHKKFKSPVRVKNFR